MANELSRVSDRLTRARERAWTDAATAWLPPPARREPTRVQLPPAQPNKHRDAGAEQQRALATLVAIHVEVRHQTEPTVRVVGAHRTGQSDYDDTETYVDAPTVEEAPPRKALAAHNAEAVFVMPVLARGEETAANQPGGSGTLHYLAARALDAYLTQHTLVSASAREPRMLDLHA